MGAISGPPTWLKELVVTAADATLPNARVLGDVVHEQGLLAARPAAGARRIGSYYTATDVGTGTTYRTDGAAWNQIAGAAGGNAPANASYITVNAEPNLSAESVFGAAINMVGTLAARPAASTDGRLYFATDDVGGSFYRDNGAAWVRGSVGNAHAALHNAGGADVLAIDAAAATGSLRTVGTGALQAQAGNLHTTASADLAADASGAVANTFLDGPSVSLVAGTWLVVCCMTVRPDTADTQITGRITDGTTHYASQQVNAPAAVSTLKDVPLAMAALITLGVTTTIKGQVAAVGTGGAYKIKAATDQNGSGNNASHIRAVKVAP